MVTSVLKRKRMDRIPLLREKSQHVGNFLAKHQKIHQKNLSTDCRPDCPSYRLDFSTVSGIIGVEVHFQSPTLLPLQNLMKRLIFLSAITCVVLSLAVAVAQEPTQEPAQAPVQERTAVPNEERLVIETRERESLAMRGLRPARDFQRRLPNGFGPLVNPAQREQIYDIQREYHEMLSLLELRVELLRNERDVKIDAVLTPEQQQRLNRPIRQPLLPRLLAR